MNPLHEMEALRTENTALRKTIAGLEYAACLGEFAGPLTHEFANFLNVLLLQVAVLEHQLPEKHRADLIEIRRQGALAAQSVSDFYQHRQDRPSLVSTVGVNACVREVACELERNPPVSLGVLLMPRDAASPAPDPSTLVSGIPEELPPEGVVMLVLHLGNEELTINTVAADFRRLLRFLMANAVRAAANGGREVHVTIQGGPSEPSPSAGVRLGAGITVKIEDSGPSPGDDMLPRIFELTQRNREGVDVLEIASSRSIARRLGGSIQAEARREGGLRLTLEISPSR